MTFNHVIKLLVNLFVFLLSAWGEDESRLELRALAAFVLLLAQCLPGPATTETDGGRHRWRGGEMYGRKQMTKMRRRGRSDRKHREKKGEKERKERWEEGSGFNKRYLHTVSVCWSSDQCPRLFSCTCPQTRGCGRPSRLRRGLGCHSHLGPSFSMSANRAVAQHSWRTLGWGTVTQVNSLGGANGDELWGVAL